MFGKGLRYLQVWKLRLSIQETILLRTVSSEESSLRPRDYLGLVWLVVPVVVLVFVLVISLQVVAAPSACA